jgi:hypothetical protein
MKTPPAIEDAILSLNPDSKFIVRRDENSYTIEWEQHQMDNADIEAELDVLTNNWLSEEYKRKRVLEYPSIDELIVALWEGVVEERMAAVTKLEAKRQAVKLKYPK